jgi:hypothetical protein
MKIPADKNVQAVKTHHNRQRAMSNQSVAFLTSVLTENASMQSETSQGDHIVVEQTTQAVMSTSTGQITDPIPKEAIHSDAAPEMETEDTSKTKKRRKKQKKKPQKGNAELPADTSVESKPIAKLDEFLALLEKEENLEESPEEMDLFEEVVKCNEYY